MFEIGYFDDVLFISADALRAFSHYTHTGHDIFSILRLPHYYRFLASSHMLAGTSWRMISDDAFTSLAHGRVV
jgi:Golgi nucleoside diphosphatase